MVEEDGIVNGKYRKEPNHGEGMSPVPPQENQTERNQNDLDEGKKDRSDIQQLLHEDIGLSHQP